MTRKRLDRGVKINTLAVKTKLAKGERRKERKKRRKERKNDKIKEKKKTSK